MVNVKRTKIWRQLQHAICTAQTDLSMELLYKIKSEELKECEKYGYTLLYYAVVANNIKVCQFITSIKPQTIDYGMYSLQINPFLAAIALGHKTLCELFIKCNPRVLQFEPYILVRCASKELLSWDEEPNALRKRQEICKLLVNIIKIEDLEKCINLKENDFTLADVLFNFGPPKIHNFFVTLLENEKKRRSELLNINNECD